MRVLPDALQPSAEELAAMSSNRSKANNPGLAYVHTYELRGCDLHASRNLLTIAQLLNQVYDVNKYATILLRFGPNISDPPPINLTEAV